MMTNRLIIDGTDVWTTYRTCVMVGGWNDLLAMPPMKPVPETDWHELDGVEPDLSAPKLDSREVTISFAFLSRAGWDAFLTMLGASVYHTFDCRSIARTYQLRFVGAAGMEEVEELKRVDLIFADDFPMADYTYRKPLSHLPANRSYTVDGKPFTRYGAIVLEGLLPQLETPPRAKRNLLQSSSAESGARYDGGEGSSVVFEAKDVRIPLLFRAATLQELWRNYDALLHDLTQPDERTLHSEALQQDFRMYYRSSAVHEFYPTDGIWLQMELNIRITGGFRIQTNNKQIL